MSTAIEKQDDKKKPAKGKEPFWKRHPSSDQYTIFEKLDEARAILMDRKEYLAHGVHALRQPKITKSIPTAGVGANKDGGVEFYFNPEFIESLSVEDLAFVMSHEAMHVLANHITTKKENHVLWNICCDVIVNTWLLHGASFNISKDLHEMLWDAKKIDFPEYQLLQYVSAEDLYDQLEPQVQKVAQLMKQYMESAMGSDMQQGGGPGQGNPNGQQGNDPNLEDSQGPSSGATADEHQGWDAVADAACEQIAKELKENGTFKKAKNAGKVPAGLERAFEEIEQVFNWDRELERFLASRIKRISTWERPNRRLQCAFPEVNIPGEKQEHIYTVLVYADMSGSIGPDEVGRFVNILKKKPDDLTVDAYSFDTRIYEWKNWETEYPKGGGGTSFQTVVNHAQKLMEKKKVDGVVVLTDGYDAEPTVNSPKKWLWVSTGELHSKKSGFWTAMPPSNDRATYGRRRRAARF